MPQDASPPFLSATQDQADELVLEILPAQGQWSGDDYLWLTDHTPRLVELSDGYIEELPMPTDRHQTIVLCLYELLAAFLRPLGGKSSLLRSGSKFESGRSASRILSWCALRTIHAARTASGSARIWSLKLSVQIILNAISLTNVATTPTSGCLNTG